MPRQPSTHKHSAGRQATLAFNTRVTKAVTKSGKEAAVLSVPPPVVKEVRDPVPKTSASRVELRAEKVTEAEIKDYWRVVENARQTKRVHQEDLDTSEKILRYFDVCSHYGPCTGLTRLKRWQRAERLGLEPPIEVLAILLKDEEINGVKKHERAHMDQILNPVSIMSS